MTRQKKFLLYWGFLRLLDKLSLTDVTILIAPSLIEGDYLVYSIIKTKNPPIISIHDLIFKGIDG